MAEHSNKPTVKPKQQELLITDVTCPVCLSILIEPVTMPCNHALCLNCFELNVTESNLACPLCRKRISVWVRKTRKKRSLLDEPLWQKIQDNFKDEIDARLNGKDELENSFLSTLPPRRESVPGEIREEFDAQLKKLQQEEKTRKRREDLASEKVIEKFREEIAAEEAALNTSTRLCQGDMEFAKRLRIAQMKETFLSNLKLGKFRRSNLKHSSLQNSVRDNSIGTLDNYLDFGDLPATSNNMESLTRTLNTFEGFREPMNTTPKSWRETRAPPKHTLSEELKGSDIEFTTCFESSSLPETLTSTPTHTQTSSPCHTQNSSPDNINISSLNHTRASSLNHKNKFSSKHAHTTSTNYTHTHNPNPNQVQHSSRLFKDITSSYSSESETEFDSEENIKVGTSSPTVMRKKNYEAMSRESVSQSAPEERVSEDSGETVENLLNEDEKTSVLKAFVNDTEHMDEDLLSKLVSEQRALEDRLKQENEDRRLALQLQKDQKKKEASHSA